MPIFDYNATQAVVDAAVKNVDAPADAKHVFVVGVVLDANGQPTVQGVIATKGTTSNGNVQWQAGGFFDIDHESHIQGGAEAKIFWK